MPEPDAALTRGEPDDYLAQHPDPFDVRLVAVVADSSLADNQSVMAALYGGAAIPIYWIVNLVERRIEVYSEPYPNGYRKCTIYASSDSVPVVIDGVEVGRIPVSDILPRFPR